MEDGILPLGFLLALLIRWTVSLFPYSGKGKSPMFGDYEAQRHWQEITWNLPVQQWYTNSSKNDLLYWGLDYPPLTAYHSYLCGYVAHKFNSSWVKLFSSRGFESASHKLFMRSSVFLVDILIFVSASYVYWFYSHQRIKLRRCTFIITLLYPGLLLIDHGHFQYNCVSLGLTLWALWAITKNYDLLGAGLFTLALNYKQMELYHALPFFCYLLGGCLQMKPLQGVVKVIKLAATVTAVFAICWYPYIWNLKTFRQVFQRLFPFSRGIYEDKVANIWFCLSLLIKFKSLFSLSTLVKISLGATVLAVLPSSLDLLLKPSVKRFKLALVNSSLVFFLFSFQVHEKSILLAALPACCLLPYYRLPSIWFLMISVFSMFPLLVKDQLELPLLSTSIIFFILAKNVFLRPLNQDIPDSQRIITLSFYASLIGAVILCLLALLVSPPTRYPDLHAVINCIYSCTHFLLFCAYFHWKQFTLLEEDEFARDKKYR